MKFGDKTGAKLILDKRKIYAEQIIQIKKNLSKLKEEKAIADYILQLEDSKLAYKNMDEKAEEKKEQLK